MMDAIGRGERIPSAPRVARGMPRLPGSIAPFKFLLVLRTADQLLRTENSLLRTADQVHFGLLTNCGLGNLLRTAKLTAANCGLRTLRISRLVSQFAVSPPIRS